VEFIGWRLSCSRGHLALTLPALKLYSCQLWLRLALESPPLPLRVWDTLTGVLEFASAYTTGASTRMAALYSNKARANITGAEHVKLSIEATAAARWFLAQLPDSTVLLKPWLRIDCKGVAWAMSDASGEGGLGGIVAFPDKAVEWFSHFTHESRAAQGNGNSTLLELAAAHAAMHLLANKLGSLEQAQYYNVHLAVDSQAAAALLRRGRCTTSVAANRVVQRIATLCDVHSMHLHVHWLPREYNSIADALSHPDQPQPPPVITYDHLRKLVLTHSDSAQTTPRFAAERVQKKSAPASKP